MRKHYLVAALLFVLFVILMSFVDRTAANRPVTPQETSAVTALELQPFLSGLSSPLYLTSAKDGTNRLFIVEQGGIIKVLQPGSSTPTVFLNITTRVLSGGERGLLGLAFHPQYSTNRRFFVNYTRQTDGATVIAEYTASAGNPNIANTTETVFLVIPQPFPNHNGGMIEFGQDGFLYIGMGDGGSANDPGNRAQNINDLLGKMLRINVDVPDGAVPYSSPPTNPFFGPTAGRDEIYAVGLRNPFRWSFDRVTGQLFAGDVGQGAREEVDIITLGGNYGWRVFEGTLCTNLGPPNCASPGFTHIPPITEYSHSGGRCSITGGYVYRGSEGTFPAGAYLFGDFCTGEIFQFHNNVQSVLLNTDLNISSFGEDESGELYVVNLGGTILKMANTTPPTCTFSINPTSQSFGAGGGTGSVTVTAGAGCNWTAQSNAGFITITGGASGSGNGTVNFSVTANTSTTPRSGTMTIAGHTFTVNQSGAPCSFSINPTSQSFGAGGGTGSVTVTAGAGCNWTAQSNAGFITITGGASGSGNGTVNYSVASHTGSTLRSGTMTIAGQTFTVNQQAPTSCVTSVLPSSRSFTANGGTGAMSVQAPISCNWTSVSNVSWVTITSGGSGPGTRSLKYVVAPNTGPQRTGQITIGSFVHTVIQAGQGCNFSINPTSQSFGSGGGTGSVGVTAAAGCAWTARSNATFITVTSGSSGSGNGTVNYSVAANTSSAQRSGTVTIAGQTFTVIQSGTGGGCTFSINPTGQNFVAAGGSGTVGVTAGATCNWTAVSNAAFITITGGSSGTGNGTVNFNVAANTSASQRTGTMTIAGQTFTVTQEGTVSGCTFTLSPSGANVKRAGGSGTTNVLTGNGCSWTAVSNAPWIMVTSGSSGSGNGTVTYTVDVNTTGTTRTGTITIGGKTFTIKQSGI